MTTPAIFTIAERGRLRATLLERATTDPRISSVAITGSATTGKEDQWSDVDLALAVVSESDLAPALADWTDHLYRVHGAAHHVDLRFGAWTYRVFLLNSTLQVDLAFVPQSEFRALAPSFQLISGKANEPSSAAPPDTDGLIGMAWLYALHARSSIARERLWEAEYMVSATRDHVLTLACIRHGLPAAHGRGFDQLPADVTRAFEESLPRALDRPALHRAFQAALTGLLTEVEQADSGLAARLRDTIKALARIE